MVPDTNRRGAPLSPAPEPAGFLFLDAETVHIVRAQTLRGNNSFPIGGQRPNNP